MNRWRLLLAFILVPIAGLTFLNGGCKQSPPVDISCQQIVQCQSTACKKLADSPYSETREIEQCLTDCARRGSVIGQRQFKEVDICTDVARHNPDADVSKCALLPCD